ncbi:hypothetical protein BKA62DRAFT_717353 [Auriculariales sp. MPI-PUGE-AT-0066]|nr:hypothetical protein BKA62DRAFT_717353 [Auriculariales sp. MPI-PUGE-AT-0066]
MAVRFPRCVNTVYAPPAVVQNLTRAANNLDTSWQTAFDPKSSGRVPVVAREIASAISWSCQNGRLTGEDLSPAVLATITVAQSMMDECCRHLDGHKNRSQIQKLTTLRTMNSLMADYAAGFTEVLAILQIKSNSCKLIDDPKTTVFSVTVEEYTLNVVGARITALDATYDTFKLGLMGLASITDGMFWPLKAAPQTAMMVLTQLEFWRSAEPKVDQLLQSIQAYMDLLSKQEATSSQEDVLLPEIQRFFAILQVISVRLRIFRSTDKVVKLLTAQRIQAMVTDAIAQLQAAREQLMMALLLQQRMLGLKNHDLAVKTHAAVIDLTKTHAPLNSHLANPTVPTFVSPPTPTASGRVTPTAPDRIRPTASGGTLSRFVSPTGSAVTSPMTPTSALPTTPTYPFPTPSLISSSPTGSSGFSMSRTPTPTPPSPNAGPSSMFLQPHGRNNSTTSLPTNGHTSSSPSLGRHGRSASTSSLVRPSASVPAPPVAFHGRDQALNALVDLAIAIVSARLATCLVLALLHDPRVVNRFGDRRVFVSCEKAADADGIVMSLARVLGAMAKDRMPHEMLDKVIEEINGAQGPTLVVLDGLESVWNAQSESDERVEELLSQLTGLSNLTLVVTTRLNNLPTKIRWTNPHDPPLQPIDLTAARATYLEIIGSSSLSPAEEDDLAQLLGAVDCMPLAVALLARLHQNPSQLLRQWCTLGTELLQADQHDGRRRDLSVEVSLNLSLSLLPGVKSDPEPLQLLVVIAHLPDGLFSDTLEYLRPTFQRIDRAVRCLLNHALIGKGQSDELKMLGPVRWYVQRRYKLEPQHLAWLKKRYFALARAAPKFGDSHFAAKSVALAPEVGNLNALLLYLVREEDSSEDLFNAAHSAAQYAYATSSSFAALEKLLPSIVSKEQLTKSLQALGKLYQKRGEFAQAIDYFGQAKAQAETIPDARRVAWCDSVFEKTRGCEFEVATCTQDLGDILLHQGKYTAAGEHLQWAADRFGRLGKRLNRAQCKQSLGRLQVRAGNSTLASLFFNEALQEYTELGDKSGLAKCNRLLGQVMRQQHDYTGSEAMLDQAIEVLKQKRDLRRLAACECDFALLRVKQRKSKDAVAHFDRASKLYRQLGMNADADNCDKRVEGLRRRAERRGESKTPAS